MVLALCGPFGQLYVEDSARAIGLLFGLSIFLRVAATMPGLSSGWIDIAAALIWIAAAEGLMLSRLGKTASRTESVAV